MSVESVSLYPYQNEAVIALRRGVIEGHRAQMLCLPTGAGKSIIAVNLIESALQRGTRVAVLSERTALVSQFSRHLDRASISHGIMQADHPRYKPAERVQVCSQQTLESRGWPDVDLIIVDEAQVCRKQVMAWLDRTKARVVGLSATPFTKGLGKTYTNVVSPVTHNQLVAQGKLCGMRVFSGVEADLRGARKTASEWQAGDVANRSIPIIGSITQEWIKHAYQSGNPRQFKTFLFSPTVDYGEMLCEQFNSLGYRFAQISYRDTDMDRRERLLAELNDMDSDLCGIVSVDALSRGTDVPNLRCVDMCRPYRKSFMSHIQALGRGLRSAPGKDFCTVLCHSGNMVRFMDDMNYLFEHGVDSLDDGRLQDGVRKEKTKKEKKDILCSCGATLMPWDDKCPSCGKVRQKRLSVVEQVPGELRELSLAVRRNNETPQTDKERWFAAFRTHSLMHHYKPGYAQAKYKERFGEFFRQPDIAPGPIFPEAQGWLTSQMIRYQHRRRA